MFTYQFGANPPIDYPRLLISDTKQFGKDGTTPIYIFEDSEIDMFTALQTTVFQSSMFYNAPAGRFIPGQPVSYLRIAALALDSIAANKSRLASITELLDVKLSPDKAAKALRDQAAEYRQVDDDSAAFAIIEQVNDDASFRDRWWKTVQRQAGGVL